MAKITQEELGDTGQDLKTSTEKTICLHVGLKQGANYDCVI